MQFLFYMLVIAAIVFTIFIIYIINIIKTGDWDTSLKILNIFVKYGLIIFILSQIILSIFSLFYIGDGLLIFVFVIKQLIVTTFFIFIYFKTMNLLDNLNNNNIFLDINAKLSQEIGLYFLYLSVTEIVIGFILGFSLISSSGSFNIATNNTIFVYIIVGLVLQIISKILQKATEIYEENQLTI
ncbi:MAG: hypothetical protein KQ78_00165 [Candidatus Izimaplasma bacterium HR2]|nr:MAG: hypothetical protein KQ78_00165 [Candidatus Izimaplasma bacterium HR2]